MSLLDTYEGWLIGEEIEKSSRTRYLYIARRVIEHMFGTQPSLSAEEMKDVIASQAKEQLNVIKEKVCWTRLDGKRAKQNSAASSCACLNSFLEFAGNNNEVKVPGLVRVERIPLSPEESKAMFEAAGHYRDPVLAARNQAIMALLLEGAIRRGKFNPLREDLVLDEGYYIIRDTKNGNDVKIPLPDYAIDAVRAYLHVRLPSKDAEDNKRLFISGWGNALCDESVYKMVKECATWAGIKKNVFPHLCRHTKATDLIAKGVNPWWVKDFMGQKNIASLGPYIHSADQQKQRGAIAALPLVRSADDGDEAPAGSGPTVRIDDAPGAGAASGSDAVVKLTLLLADGRIDAGTYSKALDALTQSEAAR